MRSGLLNIVGVAMKSVRLPIRGLRSPQLKSADSVEVLVERHFEGIGDVNHPSRVTLTEALRRLGGRPARIIETGTAAWGTQSTLLFSAYVDQFGGEVVTIDTRIDPALRTLCRTVSSVHYIVGDSASVLARRKVQDFAQTTDLVYLDSWDVDSEAPLDAARHGLLEFLTICKALPKGALILIDDTPVSQEQWGKQTAAMTGFFRDWGVPVGKGALVLKLMADSEAYQNLMHDYQLLIEKS